MATCPRCGAPTSGVRCAACGEALVFAPPAAHVELAEAGPAVAGQGAGWLIAVGIIQILLGGIWLIGGILFALMAESGELVQQFSPQLGREGVSGILRGVGIFFVLGAIATIVVSSFLIARRKWAWIVSLIFDALWVFFDLLALVKNPGNGLPMLAVSVMLLVFLFVGRRGTGS